MNFILLTNDNIPLHVNREEMPTDERNNQFFVYELPEVKKGKRRADMQKMLVDRLGYYLRTELNDVFDSISSTLDDFRYSITTPITDAEIDLFNDNMTESDSFTDLLIQKINLMESNSAYYPFIKIGLLPVDKIKDYGDLNSRYSTVVKNLKKRQLIKGNAEKKQIERSRFYCFEMTNRMIELIK